MSDTVPPAAQAEAEANRALRHDLRTPINHITGYAELLLEDAAETAPALVPELQEIRTAAGHALDLIDPLVERAASLAEGPTPASEALIELARQVAAHCRSLAQTAASAVAADLRKIEGAAQELERLVTVRFAPATVSLEAEHGVSQPGVVLVVDDNELNRDMLGRRLGRLGYSVLQAENGVEALEVLRRQNVDLLLLDIMMPELDGYGVLERRRADARLREIPTIMISAVDELDSVARCITLGAEDYLPKPFNPVILKARLEACLERKRRRDREIAELSDVARLTDAATAVEAGTFDPESLAGLAARQDPLGGLARVLVRMAGTVREREAQLQTQLRDRSYVFLSYTHTDQERVEPIVDGLEAAGISVWLDRHDIAAGATWSAEIVQSIRNCAALLVACSPVAMRSRNVRQEIQLAWKFNRPYVPLILAPTEFPDEVAYQLEGWQWVDVLDHPPAGWLPALCQALTRFGLEAKGT